VTSEPLSLTLFLFFLSTTHRQSRLDFISSLFECVNDDAITRYTSGKKQFVASGCKKWKDLGREAGVSSSEVLADEGFYCLVKEK